MTEPNWNRVKDIFHSALEIQEADRPEYLDVACDGDGPLLREVKSLLASHTNLDGFIEAPAFSIAGAVDEPSQRIDQQFGSYKIVSEIGVGGMGAVFLAVRTDGEFEQQVALKIVRQTIADSDLIERFKRERQILASLSHPNIAKLLDGGVSKTGEPFLAMEYIRGETIIDFAQRQKLSTDERLTLFLKVCSAVAYAHRNLVVHRDVKPGNILVTVDGEPKLLDFGLAKLTSENRHSDPVETQTAFRALTPAYASPEQLRGTTITTASDVYSLGVVLFELLTGERPFSFEAQTLDAIIRTLTSSEPILPSRTSPVNAQLNGDLDNIILTALRVEPERRYKSVEALAVDIDRHLNGMPISARPNTFKYRSGKFIRRHKIAVLAASIIFISLMAGFAATLWQSRVAEHERDQAQKQQERSEQLNNFLQTILSSASPEESGKDAKVIEVLDNAANRIDTEFAGQPELKAQALLTIGRTYTPLGLIDKADVILRKAYELSSEVNGTENATTSTCMMYLGVVSMNKGRLEEAESLLTNAIRIERKILPVARKETGYALNALGEFYVRKGDYEKARTLLLESISIYDALFGPNNADSAFVLISLGRAQSFSGDLEGAEATYRKSLSIYRQLPKPYKLRIAVIQYNLGSLFVTQGKYDEGIAAIREADATYQRMQGDSLNSFFAKATLCRAFYLKGDFGQVVDLGTDDIQKGRTLKLEGSSDFLSVLQYTGLSMTRIGDKKKGEELLREALRLAENTLPRDLAGAQGALGENLTAQKRFAEAEPFLKHSFDSLLATQEPTSPRATLARSRLIALYKAWGKGTLTEQYRQ